MDLDIEIITPDELSDGLALQWRSFQQTNAAFANPFLTPNFVRLFGRHRQDARVAVIASDSEVVGFLPFCAGRAGVMSALGLGVADAQAMIHGDFEPDLLRVTNGIGASVFQFDHWTAKLDDSLSTVSYEPSPFVATNDEWDKWISEKAKSSKRVNTARQKQRKLERERGALRFEANCKEPGVLDQLIAWKSAQYKRTGRFDRFARPWLRSLVWDCFQEPNDHFEARLSVLRAGDDIVNIDLSLLANGVLAGWFPAYNQELGHYSPGFVAMLEMIKSAMSSPEITELDMGKGGAPYKETLKSGDHMVAEGWVQQDDLAAKMWRARTEPKRRAMSVVLGNPKLRVAARETLNRLGSARSKIR